MSTQGDGSARQAVPGRLSNFEDADDEAPITLPARKPKQGPTAVADASTSEEPVTATSLQPAARTAKEPGDRMQASNVHIPVSLLAPVKEKCRLGGLSHGEVIIVAIENAHPRLAELINPAAKAGGTLFAARTVRPNIASGTVTPLNYRLRKADFAVLDGLAEQFGASSRGQLITVALTDYFEGVSET